MHVVERGVIFVDLSLAQIAALGATIAILVGMDPHGAGRLLAQPGVHASSARPSSPWLAHGAAHIPQEAFIGICYAVASAAAILAMSKATGETEHLKDMLVGNILAVSVARGRARRRCSTARSALFHYIFRQQVPADLDEPRRRPRRQGFNVRFWDFLFYASFGFVVTSSVAIAGVLLVFCYLIVPSVGAMLFADRIGPRLAIGWTMGTLVSALGVYLSVMSRSADRRDDRVHLRRGADPDVSRALVVLPPGPRACPGGCGPRAARQGGAGGKLALARNQGGYFSTTFVPCVWHNGALTDFLTLDTFSM